jgi:hypothetical protein
MARKSSPISPPDEIIPEDQELLPASVGADTSTAN